LLQQHGLKIGTIADLIQHRSRNESLIEQVGSTHLADRRMASSLPMLSKTAPARACTWPWSKASGTARDDGAGPCARAPLGAGRCWTSSRSMHSWSLDAALATRRPRRPRRGGAAQLRRKRELSCWTSLTALPALAQRPERGRMDLRTYGIGAQILRKLRRATKCNLMGSPRRMPSMTGYGLEITGYISQ